MCSSSTSCSSQLRTDVHVPVSPAVCRARRCRRRDIFTQSRSAAFDVVSVKRFQADAGRPVRGDISVLPGGRFSAPSATLRGLITAAYGLLDIQLVDAGRQLGDNRFEIEGRTKPDVTIDEARAMVRSLLTERFALVAHPETRELPVYVMTMAREDRKPGPQLVPSGPECALPKGPNGVPPPPPPPGGPTVGRVLALNGSASRCGSLFFNSTSGGHWSLRETTLARVADRLIDYLGRPVIDRTGLSGNFDVDADLHAGQPRRRCIERAQCTVADDGAPRTARPEDRALEGARRSSRHRSRAAANRELMDHGEDGGHGFTRRHGDARRNDFFGQGDEPRDSVAPWITVTFRPLRSLQNYDSRRPTRMI